VLDPQGRELYFYLVIDSHARDPRPQRAREETQALERQGFRVVRMYGPMPKD
jgi:hypothetical protein